MTYIFEIKCSVVSEKINVEISDVVACISCSLLSAKAGFWCSLLNLNDSTRLPFQYHVWLLGLSALNLMHERRSSISLHAYDYWKMSFLATYFFADG